jgi:hypothetical protein
MRTASIHLALIVVLGFARGMEAQQRGSSTDVPNDITLTTTPYADIPTVPTYSYTVTIGRQLFGFQQWADGAKARPYAYFGPLGHFSVPFTATQGLVGFCVFLVLLVIVPVVLKLRWKRRQPKRL